MSKRIDLTEDALRKQIHEHEEKYHKPTTPDVETILHAVTGIGLNAELKRCYKQENELLIIQAQTVVDLMELWKVSDTGRNEKSNRVNNIVCEELLRIARSIAERKASE